MTAFRYFSRSPSFIPSNFTVSISYINELDFLPVFALGVSLPSSVEGATGVIGVTGVTGLTGVTGVIGVTGVTGAAVSFCAIFTLTDCTA